MSGPPRLRTSIVAEVASRYRDLCDVDLLTRALCANHVRCVTVNSRRADAATLAEILGAEGLDVEAIPWSGTGLRIRSGVAPGTLWPYHAGLYHVQEEASMVPTALLALEPGQRVLDMCAAPGNKTAQIAAELGPSGLVVANDRSAGRLAAISNYVDHLGLCNVVTTRGSGQHLAGSESYDRVLVDAPCSGEGTLRRRQRFTSYSKAAYRDLLRTQRELLKRAIELTRPGGRIVYSTCTFSPEENELVVSDVFRDHEGEVDIVPARIPGLPSSPGVTSWREHTLPDDVSYCLRLWPHVSNTAGFFVAVFEKKGVAQTRVHCKSKGFVPAHEHPLLAAAAERFGVPLETFSRLRADVRGRYVRAVSSGHPLPQDAMTLGIAAAPKDARVPRLATAGVLEFASSANAHVVDVDAAGARSFAAGDRLTTAACPEQPGYYIVRHAGHPLGNATSNGTELTSLYPKAWRRGPAHAS